MYDDPTNTSTPWLQPDLKESEESLERQTLFEADNDERLCEHFRKRMPLEGSVTLSTANQMLRGLHEERQRRMPAERAATTDAVQIQSVITSTSMTNFTLSDVVKCNHAGSGRCLQCTGRSVRNVSLDIYLSHCQVFNGVEHFTKPTPEEARNYALPSRSLASGEILFASFSNLLGELDVGPEEHFLDLGSGVGRAVVAAALLFPRWMSAGIEIRPSLHQAAMSVKTRLPLNVSDRVHFENGDLFECSWHEASVILINSTGFEDDLMLRVAAKLKDTAAGTLAITLSQPLSPSHSADSAMPVGGFACLIQTAYRMTWGNATAYVYRRMCDAHDCVRK